MWQPLQHGLASGLAADVANWATISPPGRQARGVTKDRTIQTSAGEPVTVSPPFRALAEETRRNGTEAIKPS
jgi:hypothetical protein